MICNGSTKEKVIPFLHWRKRVATDQRGLHALGEEVVNPVWDMLGLRYYGTSRWRNPVDSWMYIDLRLRSQTREKGMGKRW